VCLQLWCEEQEEGKREGEVRWGGGWKNIDDEDEYKFN